MVPYRTPGVYLQWQDLREDVPVVRRTDIAGFVGIADRGPLHTPVRVQSWTQFTTVFGGYIPQAYLAYAVAGFFANGGRTCWVVRVADPNMAKHSKAVLLDDNDNKALHLTATSPGVWGDLLRVTVLRTGSERFSLIVRDGRGNQEVWRDLDLVPRVTGVLNDPDPKVGSQWLRVMAVPAPASFDRSVLARRALAGGHFTLSGGIDGPDPQPAQQGLKDEYGHEALRVTASTSGAWGNEIQLVVSPSGPGRFDLHVSYQEQKEQWRALSLASEAERLLNDETSGSAWLLTQLAQESGAGDGRVLDVLNLRAGTYALAGGIDGLESLTTNHFIGNTSPCQGVSCLAAVDEISQLAIPDLMPKPRVVPRFRPVPPDCRIIEPKAQQALAAQEPEFPPAFDDAKILRVQQAMIRQCEHLKDRIAILDPKPTDLSRKAILDWRSSFDTSYAALYFPWIFVPDPLELQGLVRAIPPDGHLAGVYARNDLQSGAQRSPANRNLIEAKAVTVSVDEMLHGELNDKQVNVIRRLSEGDIRILGGRTLSSDTTLRYINVRRLLAMIGETLDERGQSLVFEPNNANLWRQIDRVVRAYLDLLWRRGMLDGATPEEAFSVQCDAETNPPASVDEGKVICLVTLNLPWPAEFVIVRIGFTSTGVELEEI